MRENRSSSPAARRSSVSSPRVRPARPSSMKTTPSRCRRQYLHRPWQIPQPLIDGFGGSMAPRAETEKAVLNAVGVRGIVIRPGLVYGEGRGYDLPNLIALTTTHGAAPHLGTGGVRQGYVHLDDLVEVYALALERAPAGTMLHGVTDEIALGDLAVAVSRLVGAKGRTESLSLMEMYTRGGGRGVSLSVNKRLASGKTRKVLNWTPSRYDILEDVEHGSYAVSNAGC